MRLILNIELSHVLSRDTRITWRAAPARVDPASARRAAGSDVALAPIDRARYHGQERRGVQGERRAGASPRYHDSTERGPDRARGVVVDSAQRDSRREIMRGTSSGIMACHAGAFSAEPRPSAKVSTSSSIGVVNEGLSANSGRRQRHQRLGNNQ